MLRDDSGVGSGSPDVKWPLVGRAAELKQVSTLLHAGHGAIVLAGAAGVGKTRLATECLAVAAAWGFVPLRVAATQGAAGLPFGAFASLVPDLTLSANLLEVLHKIVHTVVGRGKGKPVAVLVDDAHLLDQSSAALTHLLATTQQTLILATMRSGEQAPDAVVALWKDELAERIELHPFAVHEVEELLTAALRGPVDGATVHSECWRSANRSRWSFSRSLRPRSTSSRLSVGDWFVSSRMAGALSHGSATRCTGRFFERAFPHSVPGHRHAPSPTL